MNAVTVAKATVTIKADVYDTLSSYANETGAALDDLVSDLIKESLTRREAKREINRRDRVLDELTEETERLGLYGVSTQRCDNWATA